MFGVKKIIATVNCLCKLQNYLIDRNLINARNVPKHSASDEFAMEINGAVPMKKCPGANFMVPDQLMGAGEHFNDDPDRQGIEFQCTDP